MTDVAPVPRSRPIQLGPERAMLESMLDFYRATVVTKVAGLTDTQAFTAAVPPSTLTPATVVKHLAGTDEECERSRRAVAESHLDDAARGEGMDFTLRYAMIHMVQETARHCGHLDLLRETTDGAVGM
jgi:hypothetical protein